MAQTREIRILGDFRPGYRKHTTVTGALKDAAGQLGLPVTLQWTSSRDLPKALDPVESISGLFIPPQATEYCQNPDGIIAAVAVARTRRVPLIANCGGAQLVILEFARNVLGFTAAQLPGSGPPGENDFITAAGCDPAIGAEPAFRLHGDRTVVIEPTSRAGVAYGSSSTVEAFACNNGINPKFEEYVKAAGLAITGRIDIGDPCVFELADHPFFMAATFLPQWKSSPERPHPLLLEFLRATAIPAD